MAKRMVTCASCDAKVDAPGMLCSASADLVCQGRDMIDGCGNVLTPEERHYYGSTCNDCEGEWCQRIEAWRIGGTDPACDQMFSGPSRGLQ
jgi:hypothetical protein